MADGWHKFVCDDELKRGDKCIIEMARKALRLKKKYGIGIGCIITKYCGKIVIFEKLILYFRLFI